MATDRMAQLTFRYQGVRPPIVACFDVRHASSDGGLVLLKAVDDDHWLRPLTQRLFGRILEGVRQLAYPPLNRSEAAAYTE